MKKKYNIMFLLVVFLALYQSQNAQCLDTSNVYSFTYNNSYYEVVRENRTWTEAVDCALERSGYLAEINDSNEHDSIFNQIVNFANIDEQSTQNQFGTASVWLGGTDQGSEGVWIWDGDNDGQGAQFWQGSSIGSAVNGLYTNWGVGPPEPDNSGGQDHLTLIIREAAVNYGLWNDLVATNSIYYLIEYDSIPTVEMEEDSDTAILSIGNLEDYKSLKVYPNPFKNFINIEIDNKLSIEKLTITNAIGQEIIRPIYLNENQNKINVSDLDKGLYILNIYFKDGNIVSTKILK